MEEKFIGFEILRSHNEPYIYSISLGYVVAHIVVTMKDSDTLKNLLTFISMHRNDKAANWMELGFFGTNSATFNMNADGFMIVIDGDKCGDGSRQSFGINFPRRLLDDFCNGISAGLEKYISK